MNNIIIQPQRTLAEALRDYDRQNYALGSIHKLNSMAVIFSNPSRICNRRIIFEISRIDY